MFSDSDVQERGVSNGRLTFAFKLWEVANDGRLIKWNSAGDGVIVDQREYENSVQDLYPRFVQNSSFLNLKRLFRDYGFQANVLRKKKPHGLKVEYTNPQFKKDNYENIINLTAKERVYKYKSKSSSGYPVYRTRRKYNRRFPTHQSVFDSLRPNTRITYSSRSVYYTPRKRGRPPTRSQQQLTSSSSLSQDSCTSRRRGRPRLMQMYQQLTPCSSANSSLSDVTELSTVHYGQHDNLNEDDMFKLFQIFAKNELSEEAYVEAVLRKFGHRFEHLADGSFEDLVYAMDQTMDSGISPFCYSEIGHEYSIDEL